MANSFLWGTPTRSEKIPKYEPYQEDIFKRLASVIPSDLLAQLQAPGPGQYTPPQAYVPPGYTAPQQYKPETPTIPVRDIGPFQEVGFGPIEQQAMQRWKSDILPGIKEQFAAGGGMRSSGYLEALDRGGQGLATNLAALGSQHALGQQRASLQHMGLGLQQQGLEQRGNIAQRGLEQQGGQFTQNLGQQGAQFAQNLGQLGTQFQQKLGQQGQQFQQNLAQDHLFKQLAARMKALGVSLTPQQDIGYFTGRPGFAETAGAGIAQGIGENIVPVASTLADKLGTVGTLAATGAGIGGAVGGPLGAGIGAAGGAAAGILAQLANLLWGGGKKDGTSDKEKKSILTNLARFLHTSGRGAGASTKAPLPAAVKSSIALALKGLAKQK